MSFAQRLAREIPVTTTIVPEGAEPAAVSDAPGAVFFDLRDDGVAVVSFNRTERGNTSSADIATDFCARLGAAEADSDAHGYRRRRQLAAEPGFIDGITRFFNTIADLLAVHRDASGTPERASTG